MKCGDCRWYELGGDDDMPGRCRGGLVAIKVWPDDKACKAMLALLDAEREREKARLRCEELDAKLYEVARTDHPRAVYSRCQLFSQQGCDSCGCVICGDNENPLVKQIRQLERERDEARVEIKRMQEWIVQCHPVLTCDRNTGCGEFVVFDGESEKGVPYWGEPDPKDDCGECVPCKARAALEGKELIDENP